MAASARIYHKVTRAGRKMAVTMSHRFDRDKQTLERLVRSGAYGPVSYIVGRLALNNRRLGDWGDFRHRIADPLLIEGAVHQFGIIRGLAGANAADRVRERLEPAVGRVRGRQHGPRGPRDGERRSRRRTRARRRTRPRSARGTRSTGASSAATGPSSSIGASSASCAAARTTSRRSSPIDLDDGDAWMNPLLAQRFVEWLDGGPPVATRIEDSIHDTALTMAAIESAHTGQVVDVPAYVGPHGGRRGSARRAPMSTVVLLGTLDTKGRSSRTCRDRLELLGCA